MLKKSLFVSSVRQRYLEREETEDSGGQVPNHRSCLMFTVNEEGNGNENSPHLKLKPAC